jgi:uncharacterized protein YeaO (DUF488 family)
MKQVKFLATMMIATATLFLGSCNSEADKKSETPVDTPAAKMETPPPATTSGPSSVMIVKHKVADYDKWKISYESHDSIRLAYGLHNYVIARGTEDPGMVMVVVKMDDVNKAKTFAAMPELKERMKKGGVVGAPSIDYLETVMNDTTAISQSVRLMVNHKVRDWDTWKKAYDSHKQARMDAGLTDRALGHTVGDNHSVTIVFAVSDVAKAKAFISSNDLKEKMAQAGVEGPPSFFFYKIAAKY